MSRKHRKVITGLLEIISIIGVSHPPLIIHRADMASPLHGEKAPDQMIGSSLATIKLSVPQTDVMVPITMTGDLSRINHNGGPLNVLFHVNSVVKEGMGMIIAGSDSTDV